MVDWYALVAPAGVPKEVVAKLNAELDAALRDKTVSEKIIGLGTQIPGAGSPEQLGAFLAREHGKWAAVSKEIGLLPE
jgi:tripartite-type tricarboxylate transporter receptor subunit TctC